MNKQLSLLLAGAILIATPAVARAQEPTGVPPDAPPPPPEMRMHLSEEQRSKLRPVMEAARAKGDALRASQLAQVRTKLSAEHLTAIQNIGQAARSAGPREGPRANDDAARLIDAVLTPRERDGVIAVILATRDRARAIAQETLSATQRILPAQQQRAMRERMERDSNAPPDAGRFLAHLTMPHHGPPEPPGPPPPR